ncbi:MAG: UbiA family prenyltransferase [Candidatus Caldarchaeum sp.]
MLVLEYDGKIRCVQCKEVFIVGYGIKYGYPRLPIARRLKAYVMLCRPFTLLAPLVAGFIGTLLPLIDKGLPIASRLSDAIFVGVTLALLQAVGQITNQICDIEADAINKPYRPLPRGEITIAEAWSLAWLLAVIGLCRAFLCGFTFGFFAILLLVMAVFYNIPPRLKRRAWLGNIWLGISRGFIPLLATWSIYGSLNNSFPYLVGGLAGLWVMALNVTKDLPDVEGDRKVGDITLPVKYGVEKTIRIIRGLAFLPFAFIAVASLVDSRMLVFFGLAPVGVLALLGFKIKIMTENTLSWAAFYGGLALIYVLSLIAVSI